HAQTYGTSRAIVLQSERRWPSAAATIEAGGGADRLAWRIAEGVAAEGLMKESARRRSRWSNMPEISSTDAAPVAGIAPMQLEGDRQLVMRVMPMPADANGNGDIFGGWIMAQVDVAGSILPARIAKGRIATVAVNEFVFKQ